MCLLIHLSSIACTHLHFEARFKKQKEKKKAKSETMLAGVKVQKSSKGRADNMSCKIFYMTTGNRRNGDKDLTSVHFLKQRKDFFFFFPTEKHRRRNAPCFSSMPIIPRQAFQDPSLGPVSETGVFRVRTGVSRCFCRAPLLHSGLPTVPCYM